VDHTALAELFSGSRHLFAAQRIYNKQYRSIRLRFHATTIFPGVSLTVSLSATVAGGATPISYAWNFGEGGGANGANVVHAYSARGI
jgi:PKD repeat protein